MSMQDIEPTEALGAEIGKYLMAFAARCKEALSGSRPDPALARHQQSRKLASI